MKEVWLIGSKNPNFDKSFTWNESFPNLSDPDVLIMDFRSLHNSLDLNRLYNSKIEIFNKFLNGGSLIFLIPDDFGNIIRPISFCSPIVFQLTESYTKKIHIKETSNFGSYLEKNKESNFIIPYFEINNSLRGIMATNQISQEITDILNKVHGGFIKNNPISIGKEILATDNSNNTISLCLWLHIDGFWKSGNLILLPITNTISNEEGVDILLEIFGKKSIVEYIPEWTSNVKIPGTDNIVNQIKDLSSKKLKLENDIKKAEKKKFELENYYRLLTAKGDILDNTVFRAFNLMGFKEIRKERPKNLEDGIFDFKFVKEYELGVIEIKGSDTRTSLSNMTQCNKWVDDYFEMKKTVKGIFVPNQFRLNEYPKNKPDRIHFEPNELQYSNSKDLCIIPCCVLFDTVWKILDGKKADRKKIEEQIRSTKGVLDVIDLS